jgi:mitochondrial fission protein ELM1
MLNKRLQQLFYRSISTLLIAVIAVVCLKIGGNATAIRQNKDITYQFTGSLVDKDLRIYFVTTAFRSNPHTKHILVLEQVIDRQVYTPNKWKGKASSIKNNLSLAKHRIVTGASSIA